MRWISFCLGAVALTILFGTAYRGAGAWVEPELESARRAAAQDIAHALVMAFGERVAGLVQERADLVALAAARLQETGAAEGVLRSVSAGVPESDWLMMEEERVVATTGAEFEAPSEPGTEIAISGERRYLLVARRAGLWTAVARFQLHGPILKGFVPPSEGVVQWLKDEQVILSSGPPRYAKARREAASLGGWVTQEGFLPGTRISAVAVPRSPNIIQRLQEAVLWLGLGSLGILALTVLLVPTGSTERETLVEDQRDASQAVRTSAPAATNATEAVSTEGERPPAEADHVPDEERAAVGTEAPPDAGESGVPGDADEGAEADGARSKTASDEGWLGSEGVQAGTALASTLRDADDARESERVEQPEEVLEAEEVPPAEAADGRQAGRPMDTAGTFATPDLEARAEPDEGAGSIPEEPIGSDSITDFAAYEDAEGQEKGPASVTAPSLADWPAASRGDWSSPAETLNPDEGPEKVEANPPITPDEEEWSELNLAARSIAVHDPLAEAEELPEAPVDLWASEGAPAGGGGEAEDGTDPGHVPAPLEQSALPADDEGFVSEGPAPVPSDESVFWPRERGPEPEAQALGPDGLPPLPQPPDLSQSFLRPSTQDVSPPEASVETEAEPPAAPESPETPTAPERTGDREAFEPRTTEGAHTAEDREADEAPRSAPASPDRSQPTDDLFQRRTADLEPYDEAHYHDVFTRFVAAREQQGDPVGNISFSAFRRKLETSERSLLEKHGCRAVRFQVVVRDDKVTLRPQLVR
ncbi:MAG: MXAN_5187 C-terminal domain-containing protein [Myxococcota bacterium]